MRLFIDDVRSAPKGWTLAKDVETAIRLIARHSPTDISLDYDAGNGTFEPVVFFIGEKYNDDAFWADELKIKIHSANPIGAKHLKDILEEYGIFVSPITY